MSRKWKEEETNFLLNNYGVMSCREIGNNFNRSIKSVEKKVERLRVKGIIENSKKDNCRMLISWTVEEKNYLSKYYGKIPTIEISKYLNKTHNDIVCKMGYNTGHIRIKKYSEKFFDEWSNELAWLVGVVLSDGHVSNIKYSKYVCIGMCDEDVILKIKAITDYFGNIYSYEKENGKTIYCIYFYGSKIWQFFTDLGMDNSKSYTAKWPIGLPNEYTNHFIRGIFDGDGGMYIRENGYPIARISGTECIVKKVADYYGLHNTIFNNKTKTCFTVQYAGNNAVKFLNYIYKDSVVDNRMDRKHSIYKKMLYKYKVE